MAGVADELCACIYYLSAVLVPVSGEAVGAELDSGLYEQPVAFVATETVCLCTASSTFVLSPTVV